MKHIFNMGSHLDLVCLARLAEVCAHNVDIFVQLSLAQ